jgi:hypothetical protein
MELISHEFLLTLILKALSDPASTMMLFPEVVTPKAASDDDENAKVANRAL